jgi:Type II secretion system (T2SS), protein M
MTARDRLVLIVVCVLVALGAGWILVVSPERKQASKLQNEVNAASSQLSSAESQLASARQAKARYASAYSSIVSLGKAVPPGREVPSLVYQLARASNQKHVEFASIVNGTGSGSGSSGSSSSSSGAQPAALGGFTPMPFTFVFNGTFFDLYHLFQQLNGFTVRTASGGVAVSGRLLTIQSAKLAPAAQSAEHGSSGPQVLTGTITATAYVLPAAQGLTGGATTAGPTPAASSSSSGATSPTAPAIARVGP